MKNVHGKYGECISRHSVISLEKIDEFSTVPFAKIFSPMVLQTKGDSNYK